MKCLNCNKDLSQSDRFCSECGQQVDQNNLKLSTLLKEFFENYLSFDTRLGRSIKPFFTKPGTLTLEFNEGKRKNYANPFRLYIFSSVFFFFFLTINHNGIIGSGDEVINLKKTTVPVKDFPELPKEIEENLGTYLNTTAIAILNSDTTNQFLNAFNQLDDIAKLKTLSILPDELQKKIGIPSDITFEKEKPKQEGREEDLSIRKALQKIDWAYLENHRYDQSLSDSAVFNHFNPDRLGYIHAKVIYQVIKVYRSESSVFKKFILKNMSIAMFFVLPISALILMILFGWKKRFYVEYLIFSIHIHALYFFLSGFYFLINYLLTIPELINNLFIILIFLYLLVYFNAALLKVFQQKRIVVFFKGLISILLYVACFSIVFLGEVLVSFLIY